MDSILCSRRWESSIQSANTRPGADCDSDHELLVAKCRLKLKKYRENKAIQVWPNSNTLLYTRKVKVTQLCSTLCDPMDYTVHVILQARILEWLAFPFSRGSSKPRDQTQVFSNAGRIVTIWATREAQEYWRGSLSLLEGIFPTQDLNRSLLHCRRILYQLSYQESPRLP